MTTQLQQAITKLNQLIEEARQEQLQGHACGIEIGSVADKMDDYYKLGLVDALEALEEIAGIEEN